MPKISIVVPVYNVEQYISKCIESILSQTLTDFELILVNDGSRDKSGEICERYMKDDSRVRVFHKENAGVSSARNYGIQKAVGQWLCFVDSDDYLDPTHLQSYFDNYKEGDDLLMCGHVKHFPNKGTATVHTFSCFNAHKTIEDIIYEAEVNNIINSPVCKLFDRSIVIMNQISFDLNTNYGEDHLFVLDYCKYVENITYTSKATYHYIHRSSGASLTNKVTTSDRYVYYLIQLVNKYEILLLKHNWNFLKYKIKSIISSHAVMAIISVFDDGRSSTVRRSHFRKIYMAIKPWRTLEVVYMFQKLILAMTYLPLPTSYIMCKCSCNIRLFLKKK